jgi:uncharacterized membrane protein YraQ (UPF0718 family)
LVWQLKWWITGFFGLLYVVSLLFVLKLDKFQVVLASGVTIGIALLFRGRPIMPFMTAVALTAVLLSRHKGEPQDWLHATWDFAKQILPLLAAGVLVAGFLLGFSERRRRRHSCKLDFPAGRRQLAFCQFFCSIVGAFMYFATLTEIPILQGLMANGMGKGPALALLLAGPALSLPEYAGHPQRYGHEKNGCLRDACGHHGNDQRFLVRGALTDNFYNNRMLILFLRSRV